MKRYMRVAGALLAISLQTLVEHRAHFLTGTVASILRTAASVGILTTMFSHRPQLGGWAFHEALIVIGVYLVVSSVVASWIAPSLGSIPADVRTGTLDGLLLLPMSSQFAISFREYRLFEIRDALVGIGVILFAMTNLAAPPSFAVAVGLFVTVLTAVIIVYSLWLALMTLAFWLVDIRNLGTLMDIALRFGQFPGVVFPRWLRAMFTYIVPIILVTTIPASVAARIVSPGEVLLQIAYALVLFLGSSWFWGVGVRRYTGTST